MEIPTYSQSLIPQAQSGAGASDSGKGRGTSLLGAGISRAAANISNIGQSREQHEDRMRSIKLHQQNIIADLVERKTRQIEDLEEKKKYSQLRTDWNNRLIELSKNPTDNLMETATAEYDDYVTKMLNGTDSTKVRENLSLLSADYRIGLVNESFKLQSRQQLAQFGASFDEMMVNAESSIFNTKSLGELAVQRDLLHGTIEDAKTNGQIQDPIIIQNLKEKVNLLPVAWAESMLSDNPELVKSVALGEGDFKGIMDGVPARTRALLAAKSEESIRAKDNQNKLLLKEALESDKIQRMQTGQGESLDLNEYEAAYGKAARESAERELNMATQLHEVVEMSKGASQEELNFILENHKPKEDESSPLYGEQQALYMAAQKIISMANDDRKEDAFTYFSQHPSVRSYAQKLSEDPTPENRKELQEAVLSLQKADTTMRPYEYRVMPKGEAEKFITSFNKLVEVGNKTDGAGVREMLVNFNDEYKDHITIALSQLQQIKGGEEVSSSLNPLMWHLNNPSTFRLIVDAIRKDPQEVYQKFESDKVKNNFLTDVRLDNNLLAYESSMVASNNSSETHKIVDGVRKTFRDFTRDYVLNGGKIEDASSMFFGNYSWGELNGVSYARPLTYKDSLGKEHRMSPDQQTASSNFLRVFPRRLDADQIEPESILNETGFKPEEIKKDIENSLNYNTFWATTEDEQGVYLYTKGSILGTSKQVFYKDGTPVKVMFSETLVPIPEAGRGVKHRYQNKTTDSIWDRLANALLSSG